MGDKRRRIEQVGVLDWTTIQNPEDISDIESIEQVGVILIQEHLAGALARIPMEQVGSIAIVPSGSNVQITSGQTRTSGEALAAGDPETVWVIAGQLFITTPVTQVGYKEIHVNGQMVAPRGSETALGPKIKRLSGQVIYYPPGARYFLGDETFTAEFLELLPEPTPLMIVGTAKFTEDVTVELLKSKITEIGLIGTIMAPKALIPLLQVLTVEKTGTICES